MEPLIKEITNEDGTTECCPTTEEYEQLKLKYPTCQYVGYNCMFCSKCLLGDYFKPANDQERLIIERQQEIGKEYFLEHNPSWRNR